MSKKSNLYIKTRSGEGGSLEARSPVDVSVVVRRSKRLEHLKRGFLPARSGSEAANAVYSKIPHLMGPDGTKVTRDGTVPVNVVYVPAWLHAFYRRYGHRDLPRIAELKDNVRGQLLLVGYVLLHGGLSPDERVAYEAFLEKTKRIQQGDSSG